jgi:hypothetical protein
VDAGGATTTARTTLLAYAFPSGGGVVALGDKSVGAASSSTLLNFWGSSWSKANSVSGVMSPSAFKGYISNPPALAAPPATCPRATSFTTGPGTSASPPVTVPTYMAVLVASQVNKDGSIVSSNHGARWVVVRTAPGYGAASGHDGNGTIVADLC